jgi:hypothetical protein
MFFSAQKTHQYKEKHPIPHHFRPPLPEDKSQKAARRASITVCVRL